MISLMWAMGKNGVIGKEHALPWRLPADLAYAKDRTMGHKVILGRKTYESIGRPLPGRQMIIMTRRQDFHPEGCAVCGSIEEALRYCRDEEVFVWGGADIYAAFLPYADKLYVTFIAAEFEGDVFFPAVNFDAWTLVSKAPGERNEKNPYDYWFAVYERKSFEHGED